jgi:hypothetical protein
VSFYLHFFLLFCVIGFTPMRFPRVKAEGQSFYTASPEWLTVDSFSRLSATVPPRRKDSLTSPASELKLLASAISIPFSSSFTFPRI